MEMMLRGRQWIARLSRLLSPDGRRHVRLPAKFRATIAGTFGTIAVSGLDAHRQGVGVESPQALPLGSLLFLRITSLGLMGFAHVRHCSSRGDAYLLGLQFRDALTRERDESESWDRQQLSQTGRRLWDEAEI